MSPIPVSNTKSPPTNNNSTLEEVWKEINLNDIVPFNPPSAAVLNLQPTVPSHLNLNNDTKDCNQINRRRQRMMKNRESAARSRARKQAYVNQLQLDVARWTDENATLRLQLKKQILQAPIVTKQVPTKRILHRTLTAPF